MTLRILAATPTPEPGVSTFTVTQSATTVYTGEAAIFAARGNGGLTVADNEADVVTEWDWDDAGAVHGISHRGSTSAETTRNRVGGHVWDTPGVKSPTLTGRSRSATASQSASVTVVDHTTETWDQVWWVDLTGDTTGMPVEDATNKRILSSAAWIAKDNSMTAGTKLWVKFRRGTTHVIVPTIAGVRLQCSVIYFDTFDTGTRPVIDCAGTQTGSDQFALYYTRASQRVIFRDYEFSGRYDPVTGDRGGFDFEAFKMDAGQSGSKVSFWNCKATGVARLANLANGSPYETVGAAIDCEVRDWSDYGLGIWTGEFLCIENCIIAQNPRANSGDGKFLTTDTLPDHGPFRTGRSKNASMPRCLISSTGGWSGIGPDYYTQSPLRFLQNDTSDTLTDYLTEISDCDMYGSAAIAFGTNNGTDALIGVGREIVRGCRHYGDRFSGYQPNSVPCIFIGTDRSGIVVENNMIYKTKSKYGSTSTASGVFVALQGVLANAAQAVRDVPAVIRNNTALTDFDPSDGPIIESRTADFVEWQGDAVGTVLEANNLFSAVNYTNPGLAANTLARGDNLKAITGSAADASSTGVPPVYDLLGNLRTGTTKQGAHHATVASDPGVSTPTHSGSLVIGTITTTNTLAVATDWGTPVGAIEQLTEYFWELDGSPAPNANEAYRGFFEVVDGPGDLVLKMRLTNMGGGELEVASNTLAI